MKLESKLTKMHYDFLEKGTKFEFFCYGDETPNLEKYLGKKVNLELKGERRSAGANGYLWALLGELQESLRIPKEELYRQYVYSCGVFEVLPVKDEAVQRFIECWQSNGLRVGM